MFDIDITEEEVTVYNPETNKTEKRIRGTATLKIVAVYEILPEAMNKKFIRSCSKEMARQAIVDEIMKRAIQYMESEAKGRLYVTRHASEITIVCPPTKLPDILSNS